MSRYIIFSIICFLPFETIWAEEPGARELLEKFRATKNQTKSFIVKAKNRMEYLDTLHNYEGVKYNSTEFRTDGVRVCHRQHSWGDVTPYARDIGKDEPRYKSFLWNSEMFIEYQPSVTSMKYTRAYIRKDDKQKKAMVAAGYRGAPFLGIFEGDHDPIDPVFLGPDTTSLTVREQMESVNGYKCYVLDADTKRGKYSVWLDPTHGYNISKAEVVRRKGDFVYGHKEPMPHGEIRFSLTKVNFKKIDKIWIPMEAAYKISWLSDRQDKMVTKVHNTRTEVVLNPDHEALGSFKPDDVKNGTHVFLLGAPKTRYLWQDGRLIPDVNEAAVDQLDKMTKEIIAGRCRGGTGHPGDSNSARLVPDNVTISDLLAKYRASQDKLQSFTADGLTKVVNHKALQAKGRSEEELCEFRYDGDRVSHRSRSWDGVFTTRKSPAYKSFLWDGKLLMQYRKDSNFGEGQVFISKNDNRKEQLISKEYKGAALMGYCAGDYHRVDSIFAKAEAASLRDKTEQVGESQCYVIDTDTKRGKYTIWIDPDHGYNLAKVEVKKTKGDLFGDRETVKSNMYFSLINVRFEKVDDVWVPMEADMQLAKDNQINVWHHKRTKMRLNPDHNALGSFAADDIPNGTKVIIPALHAEYKWQNGKVVTKDGGDVKF